MPNSVSAKKRLRQNVTRRDRNREPGNTLDPQQADWDPSADNEGRARIVLQHVLTQIRPITDTDW